MKILSILWGTCSTAALMIDGEIVSCVSEERFSRVKNDDSYPLYAIEAVLRCAGVSAQELDLVVIPGERFDIQAFLCHKYSRFSVLDRLREQRDYWYPKIYQKKDVSFLDIFKDKIDTKQYPGKWGKVIDFVRRGDQLKMQEYFKEFRKEVVSKHIGVSPEKIIIVHHHLAHTYYAYYASPLRKGKVAVLSAESQGDGLNASVSLADDKGVRMLSSSSDFIIGRIYRHMTLLLGMKPDEHEYKVMGLAAYANPRYCKEPLKVFQETMYVDGLKFGYKVRPPDLYFYFRDKLEGFRFDSIAGALQKYTEDIMVEWTRNALRKTGTRQVCFGGGVAMNIKAMMEIAKLPQVDNIFVCPSPSDESLAMGAAFLAMHDILLRQGKVPGSYLKPLRNSYLGPAATPQEVRTVAEKAKKRYAVHARPSPAFIARKIASGRIVGRCVGRAEFGARALGNRSIIADPRRLDIVKQINERIKCRDFWMPFAPSLLREKAGVYLLNPKKLAAPYMTVAFETKPECLADIKAAIHQYDQTVRPQLVDKAVNPSYYALLEAFYKQTGVGGVLNTSFNVHGEPIVQTPSDAFDVFERSRLDALILDGYLIERREKRT